MAPINEIVAGTALAAVRGSDGIRAYVTVIDGDIREVRYHNGLWTGGTSADFVANGKAHKNNNGWNNGSLGNLDVILHPSSSLSTVRVGVAGEIRVYGQLPNCMIQEWKLKSDESGWVVGGAVGYAIPGTAIAAAAWGTSDIHIRIYLQDKEAGVFERSWDGQDWFTTGFNFPNGGVLASLAATSGEDDGGLSIRVLYLAPDNAIKEKNTIDGSHWKDGAFIRVCLSVSKVAALSEPNSRVYIQRGSGGRGVTEFAQYSGGWSVGCEALPPA